MATLIANLKARRDAIGVELAALTSSTAGGKPNNSVGSGTDHVGYKDGLYRELEELNKQIAHQELTNVEAGGGPWEERINVR